MTLKKARDTCSQFLWVRTVSMSAHVSRQPDPNFTILFTKIGHHHNAFLGTWLQTCCLITKLSFFRLRICLETDFGRLSDAPNCNTVSLEAVKEMHAEQAFQLQLIIQILMTDCLQQETDISEDVGKGSIASSGHITVSSAIKSSSKILHGTVRRADKQCNFRDPTISLWLTHIST